ncbi:unnamed protein product [Allacma fusca]|uniref:Uncharacterized protein n=1 Tax=Allacma fusca TaxID=39272 RepID=A0A8J2K067_9HEXA|nr:unnamed protein product [Allacma fusca]
MLDLEVVPQHGLQAEQWEFLLGMHFSHAVAIIQSQIGVIKSANVVYNDQNPLQHDLILDLPLDGFRLIFESKCQRLKIIEVYNMKLVRLKYCHEAVKFILHTNFPGHYDFNSYHRCPFVLQIGRLSPPPTSPIIPTKAPSNGSGGKLNPKSPKVKKNKGSNNNNNNNTSNCTNLEESEKTEKNLSNVSSVGNGSMVVGSNSENCSVISVYFDSHWEDVNEFACENQDKLERPVVLTRSSSNNPFGSSLCYGVQDVIFEVMSNDHIASVTLYQNSDA